MEKRRPMVPLIGPRRTSAPPPAAEAEMARHRPRTAPLLASPVLMSQFRPAVARAPPHGGKEDGKHSERTARSAPTSADADALLNYPLVRDLIRENEGMLMELALLRDVHARLHITQQRRLVAEETAARAVLCASEATARFACAAALHAAIARRVGSVEHMLAEEEAENEKLRNFAELAQSQLHSRLHTKDSNDAVRSTGIPSPPIKVRRGERGSGATDGDSDSRRPSLEEITNVRGSVKRLRSVGSSESGTPRNERHRLSGAQRSPGALTKTHKAMH
ncbi:hypothetical protein ABL78_1212 [Leptomonas seymouri]|uniref:Uncharacterized protein n=1 Tax=Leptomonas seymouri TaxID=5684 RepID=A0A0N0P8A2_LEPSE|nr:hypothetical protein ABL78_1212 [Leptomonas seymouri]|eukprot:KPI89719.1 hypothetical protein ABL78_1212 [Leptomonas seymouri]